MTDLLDYLKRIPSEDIPRLRGVVKFMNHNSSDPEDWVTKVGEHYVRCYGRPTEYDSFYGIGASLIHYFGKQKNE